MNSISPPALNKGDTIGVIAPSGFHDINAFSDSIKFIEKNGYKVVVHLQTSLKDGQFAGTVKQRVRALHDYFSDTNIKAIFLTRGGNGVIHLLDQIDYNLIKSNPKIIMGFSDATSLLNAIHVKTNLITFHGPMLISHGMIDDKYWSNCFDVLSGTSNSVTLDTDKELNGTLYGGNLAALQTLIGTPYAPNLDNGLLFIEDINEHLSRYDRMIGHMKQAGWLSNLSGILQGEFINSLDNDNRPFGFTINQIIENNIPQTPKINIALGHGENLCTLPIGANAVLKNKTLSFKPLS